MDENGLTSQELAVLNTFMEQHTTEEAAELLGIPYSTCSRFVRKLKAVGMLIEPGFRTGKKRYYITTNVPTSTNETKPAYIVWNNTLQPIVKALSSFSKNQEVPIRQDVLAALGWIHKRSGMHARKEPVGGPGISDLATILRRIQVKIRGWDRMIQCLLDAPIWYDTPMAKEKLAGLFDEEYGSEFTRILHEFELRYMADGKGALEK